MRVITSTVTVYPFAELTPTAQDKAVEGIREKLAGDWWDQSDNDDLGAAIVYSLAAALKSPGWDTFGPGDFPGIDGVRIDGWDMDRGQSLAVTGQLTRENAPALPWIAGIEAVNLEAKRDHTYITVEESDPECTCPNDSSWLAPHESGCLSTMDNPATTEQRDTLEQAARDALSAAWQAGYAEMEYKSSAEYAAEWIDSNEPEFTVNGDLYGRSG